MLEAFFSAHQHTIDFVSSLGTWGAVVVALWLARASSRPRLRVFVDRSLIISPEVQAEARWRKNGNIDLEHCPEAVTVTIRNSGMRPIHIPYHSFAWSFPRILRRLGKCKAAAMQNPVTEFGGTVMTVEPGRTASIVLTNEPDKLRSEVFVELCLRNGMPLWSRRFIRLYVHTDDGYVARAFESESIREIKTGVGGVENGDEAKA